MTARDLLTGLALLAITLAGFFLFPGHTYLHQDTQIYLPMLERLWTPGALDRDLIATHPHLAFTIYDEAALWLRRLTGLDFQGVLVLQQIVLRFLGLLGVYFIARSLDLPALAALLVTGLFSLGAVVAGPTVLTFEYEPVPRGYAVLLVLLAIGCEATERYFAAGTAAALAFLYHPPSVYPYWAVYFVLILLPREEGVMWRRISGVVPLILALIVMIPLSRMQTGETERQILFGRVDASLETLQRLRASYNWISLWWKSWTWQYVLLAAVIWLTLGRAREALRLFWIGMPAIGLLSLPLSYLLLENWKWALVPQFQPMRAVLFVVVFAVIGAAAAAWRAAQSNRYMLSFVCMALVFAFPAQLNISFTWSRLAAVCLLAAGGVLACRFPRVGLALPVLAMLVIPVENYPRLHNPEVDELARWARASTPAGALFHFPDARRDLYPGIFRAQAVRAIYVDWKSGGQVNYMKSLAEEWWRRWQSMLGAPYRQRPPSDYASLGIDYIVLKAPNSIAGAIPVHANSRYVVYATSRPGSTPPND